MYFYLNVLTFFAMIIRLPTTKQDTIAIKNKTKQNVLLCNQVKNNHRYSTIILNIISSLRL